MSKNSEGTPHFVDSSQLNEKGKMKGREYTLITTDIKHHYES